MAIDRRKPFIKQPSEEYDVDVDFNDVVPLGADVILSGTATAVKWPRKQPDNKTAGPEILLSGTTVTVGKYNTKARIHIMGGVDDFDYQITVKVIWNNGARLEEELMVRVREE